MPHHVGWHIPLWVLEARFEGRVVVSEMSQLAEAYIQFLTEAEQQAPGRMIYLLFDTSDAENMPPMYSMLAYGLPVLKFKNRGPAFHVTRSGVIRKMIEVTAFVSGFKVTTYATRDSAIKAIEAVLIKTH